MLKRKVLFISQEIFPYISDTKISTICKNLPYGMQEKGKEIRLFMPKFGCVNERRNQLHEVIRLSGMNIIINDADHPLIIKVASMPSSRIQVYFIDNDEYFQNKLIIDDKNGVFYANNDERAMFFARGVIETVKNLGWAPDIIHCHGWMSHLVPMYVKRMYKDNPMFCDSKVIYTIYDDEFVGELDNKMLSKLRFDGILQKDLKHYKTPNYISTTKAATEFADAVVIGSDNINPEIMAHLSLLSKPILGLCMEENLISSVNSFYDEILDDTKVFA